MTKFWRRGGESLKQTVSGLTLNSQIGKQRQITQNERHKKLKLSKTNFSFTLQCHTGRNATKKGIKCHSCREWSILRRCHEKWKICIISISDQKSIHFSLRSASLQNASHCERWGRKSLHNRVIIHGRARMSHHKSGKLRNYTDSRQFLTSAGDNG